MILALPMPIIWRLALGQTQKIQLSFLFALGSLSCIVSIIRLHSLIVYLKKADSDGTYYLASVGVWT